MGGTGRIWSGDHVVAEMPFTLRRRIHWGDGDAALIVYTSRFVDLALEAADCWWEQVLGLNWYQLNHERGLGSPMVALGFDFHGPLRPGDRVDLAVYVEQLGNSSLALKVEGRRVGGELSFTGRLTAALISRADMRATTFPDGWRRRIEGYQRECALQGDGVRSAREVLDFWFGAPDSGLRGQNRLVWFGRDETMPPERFDAEIRERFLATYEAAGRGDLDHWGESAESALALLVVLDQFPRNMFRGTPRAYASDAKALALARLTLARGLDVELLPVQRKFVYLPFEHSEDLADQRRSFDLFEQLTEAPDHERSLDYARRHLEVIERFGRFPHRNEILGRASTPEETEFLKQPNSSF